MQWLIDLVIAAIGVPPCFYDRGDPGAWDFTHLTLVHDSAWRDLDLTAIVPNEARAVLLGVRLQAIAVGIFLNFRNAGNVNTITRNGFRTIVANMIHTGDLVCACTNGHIEYQSNNGVVPRLTDIVVKGWWK